MYIAMSLIYYLNRYKTKHMTKTRERDKIRQKRRKHRHRKKRDTFIDKKLGLIAIFRRARPWWTPKNVWVNRCEVNIEVIPLPPGSLHWLTIYLNSPPKFTASDSSESWKTTSFPRLSVILLRRLKYSPFQAGERIDKSWERISQFLTS